jgi:hypothetical protein
MVSSSSNINKMNNHISSLLSAKHKNEIHNWLTQQSTDRHVTAIGHIILIPSQPAFLLNDAFLVVKQLIL